ncbi:MAG: GGDEF domain-containing protein [Gammaproteobacteria bacterium]|nr:GGDEF domain-containing protein [Gammaproteobacteria bacterium]MBU0829787.1 GGDEF domain-containing protein [Gammaproteobacteria bacterium]MBU1816887.1 GGDEF domain-containing protein [Gammaproteobacteria bacterium]
MGMKQRQFLFGKTLTTTWPSATQIQHWNEVLRNLRARLVNRELSTGAQRDEDTHFSQSKPWQDFSVRECVAALDEMHMALQRETAQRQELERAFQTSQTALVQAETDLDRVRGGERRARHLALHDDLTSLPNRRHLQEQLGETLARRGPDSPGLSVLYLDLDAFKAVNDTYGHGVGDKVLRITAARLRGAVRQGDTVVRLGGDEFVCLLQDVADETPLRQLCNKLLQAVSTPMKIGVLQLLVRPSIGIAICPQHGTTADELLACADAAMYVAKRDGCGFAFHSAANACDLQSDGTD